MTENSAFDDPGKHTAIGLPSGFRAAVTHALTEFGYTAVEWESEGVNVYPPGRDEANQENKHYIGLSNLYRRAKAAERSEWPAMIREFLEHISETCSAPTIPDDLATISTQLRPRLGLPFSRETRAHPWGIPLSGTGLEINLVIDYPNTMAYVTEDMLKKTSLSAEDLLDLALGNLRGSTGKDFFEQVSEELDIFVGHSGDGYDAARALLIEDLLPESPAGFLVAIPSRDELVVWPVSFAALEKIHVIKMFATDNFRDHAYPVTEDVFWLWHGTWHNFGIQIDEKNVTISPPAEFMTALKELGGSNSGEGESTTP
ncbi:MAG TPA: hypothetical protein VG097_08520 [Gemmata sp.]|jgi:hypothetical protein|nr:hypothetical protein [Gemmata sp.]